MTEGKAAPVARTVLDPIDRSSEVLFGLIMVLSFTGTISIAVPDSENRAVLVGAIGCNLAWGIVDAIMYLLNTLSGRGRELKVAHGVRAAQTPETARAAVEDALPEPLAHALRDEDFARIAERVRALPHVAARPSLRRSDVWAAFLVFVLVFVSTLPVVVPFAVFDHVHLAMRVSNAIAIVMLFFTGLSVGRYSFKRPWLAGVVMVLIGLLLVAVTMALGG